MVSALDGLYTSLTSPLTRNRSVLRLQHSALCVSRAKACMSPHKQSSVSLHLAPGSMCPQGHVSVPPCVRVLAKWEAS